MDPLTFPPLRGGPLPLPFPRERVIAAEFGRDNPLPLAGEVGRDSGRERVSFVVDPHCKCA